jgi:type I restriction enzyme R subunit
LEPTLVDLHFFDPRSFVAVLERRLPHWSQPGVVTFLTWRTHDSLPAEVVESWRQSRRLWLREHRINPTANNWRDQLALLGPEACQEFYAEFSSRWHRELDLCYGMCDLRDPANSRIVADSLHYFDGQRYELTDFVVMPNHVHLLAAFRDEDAMLTQCDSWKHFTGHKINLRLGKSGRFWQQDGFDHLVRSIEQFEHFRQYIAQNPVKAKLCAGEFVHYSKDLTK